MKFAQENLRETMPLDAVGCQTREFVEKSAN